jgi:hypothetical protein
VRASTSLRCRNGSNPGGGRSSLTPGFDGRVSVCDAQQANGALTCSALYELASDNGIAIPGLVLKTNEAGAKVIGAQLARQFKNADSNRAYLEGFCIERTTHSKPRADGKGHFTQHLYTFSRVNDQP